MTAAQGSAADPSDANVIAARTIAARLLDSCRSGALVLSHPDREGETLRQLADVGHCMGPDGAPVTLAPALLRTLDRLTAQSTADKPLEILSLYRPLPAGRPHEPHGNGMAVDIAAFAGHRIRSTDPEECVAGVLAVIQTLDPGAYRLGLPRPPDTDPAASTTTTTSSDRNSNWPFFPAPQVVIDVETSSTDTPDSDPNTLTAGKATSKSSAHPRVIRWANEHYAPLADVGSSHVRAAIEAAIARGVNIHSLFPDAPDHLHLDVKPNP